MFISLINISLIFIILTNNKTGIKATTSPIISDIPVTEMAKNNTQPKTKVERYGMAFVIVYDIPFVKLTISNDMKKNDIIIPATPPPARINRVPEEEHVYPYKYIHVTTVQNDSNI